MSVSARETHEKQVKDLRESNDRRGITRNVATPSTEVHKESGAYTLHAFNGACYLETDGEIRLDQDGIFRLRKQLAAALQAVS